jgi:hypothetical protein
MRLWRLTRTGQTALDGAGTSKHGGRYSPPGAPVVNFASEAGLAVLVALRYLPGDPADVPDDYVLGWTEIDAVPESVGDVDGDDAIREWITDWLEERRSLLASVRSQVLPEADIVLMNPLHPDAARVPPLVTRPFSFAECLHTPPMLARYSDEMSERAERGGGGGRIATSLAWFPAEDYAEALVRWSSLAEDWADRPHEDYCRRFQWELLRLSSYGVPIYGVAPIRLDDYLPWCEDAGRDPELPATRALYAAELTRRDQATPWPPPRNDRCWCGSGRKYKHCCATVSYAPDADP